MPKIEIHRETPDGLDPVFEAYEQLKRIYKYATPASQNHDCDSYTGNGYCPCEDYVFLPGSQEQVCINDVNELTALEYWLAEQVVKRATGGKD